MLFDKLESKTTFSKIGRHRFDEGVRRAQGIAPKPSTRKAGARRPPYSALLKVGHSPEEPGLVPGRRVLGCRLGAPALRAVGDPF